MKLKFQCDRCKVSVPFNSEIERFLVTKMMKTYEESSGKKYPVYKTTRVGDLCDVCWREIVEEKGL